MPPTVSENAINGDAVTSAVQRTTSRAPATASAAANAMMNPAANQIRGSVAAENPSRTRGIPNAVSAGRYGSKTFGLCAAAIMAGPGYGVPRCTSMAAEWSIT